MYVRVLVRPGAKKELIERPKNDHFLISVKEKAERNAANLRVLEVLAAFFGVSTGRLRIISGHHSPSKIVSIDV